MRLNGTVNETRNGIGNGLENNPRIGPCNRHLDGDKPILRPRMGTGMVLECDLNGT